MLSLQSPFRLKTRADLPLYSSPRIRSTHQISRRDFLLTRARVTNLGLLLLASFATLSFLINLGYYFSPTRRPFHSRSPYAHPYGILSTIDRDETLNWLNHLVIVPGHAIWKGVDAKRRFEDDEWVLEAYQRGGGRVSAFVQHIERGVELMAEDEHALLVFSGGQTRRTSTTTEAESYLRLALSSGLLSDNPSQVLRATTENYALDSYQNLLFSIARFHEYTGHYPRYITIIGYEMKRRRFEELHRAALRWPRSNFDYLGIDAEGEEAIGAIEGEVTYILQSLVLS
ncbi:hypothetical protein NLI96_g1465 [Meripilus lineatus]|uniref:DUF218 domain-containing protein n=1 Tax=Meripilus lineatus TaxID=2056292 RepID=A0AAD5VBY1_9APHY|nr:hypothetical protein NLI96_g1465 [Physisporinus lineatus]